MSGLRTRLTHWWQRNFGYVYLTETRWNGERRCFRFKARLGRVAFDWWASTAPAVIIMITSITITTASATATTITELRPFGGVFFFPDPLQA